MPSLLSHHQSPHPRMSFRLLLILYLKSVRESQRGNICIYKPINCKCFEGLIILISIGRKGKSCFSIYTFTLKKSCEAASSTPPVPRTPSCWLSHPVSCCSHSGFQISFENQPCVRPDLEDDLICSLSSLSPLPCLFVFCCVDF